jgi:rubrerythrin
MHLFVCESCGTTIYSESRELPSCPICRGMMVAGEDREEKGQKWKCKKCSYEFFSEKSPFKCPVCDESFSGSRYF